LIARAFLQAHCVVFSLLCSHSASAKDSPRHLIAGRAPTTRYDDYFRKFSKRYFGPGFAWRVFKAQAMAESGLDSTAKSWVGARGIMQLMPGTYAMIAGHRSDFKSVEDAQSNIAAGIAHDADMWRLFFKIHPNPDHYRFMMGAYNAGEGPIQRAQRLAQEAKLNATTWNGVASIAPQVQRWRYQETLEYVEKIAANYRRLQQLDAVPPLEMNLELP
jgi:membrane-bound lytic murein transglycosylase MltF